MLTPVMIHTRVRVVRYGTPLLQQKKADGYPICDHLLPYYRTVPPDWPRSFLTLGNLPLHSRLLSSSRLFVRRLKCPNEK